MLSVESIPKISTTSSLCGRSGIDSQSDGLILVGKSNLVPRVSHLMRDPGNEVGENLSLSNRAE